MTLPPCAASINQTTHSPGRSRHRSSPLDTRRCCPGRRTRLVAAGPDGERGHTQGRHTHRPASAQQQADSRHHVQTGRGHRGLHRCVGQPRLGSDYGRDCSINLRRLLPSVVRRQQAPRQFAPCSPFSGAHTGSPVPCRFPARCVPGQMQQRVNAAPHGHLMSRPSDGTERFQLVNDALQQIGIRACATGPPPEDQANLLIRESTGPQRTDPLVRRPRPALPSNQNRRLFSLDTPTQVPDLITHSVVSHAPHHAARRREPARPTAPAAGPPQKTRRQGRTARRLRQTHLRLPRDRHSRLDPALAPPVITRTGP